MKFLQLNDADTEEADLSSDEWEDVISETGGRTVAVEKSDSAIQIAEAVTVSFDYNAWKMEVSDSDQEISSSTMADLLPKWQSVLKRCADTEDIELVPDVKAPKLSETSSSSSLDDNSNNDSFWKRLMRRTF